MRASIWSGVLVVAGLGIVGCGDKEGSGDGSCRDLEGPWVMVEHCMDDVLGTAYELTQDGCDLDVVSSGPEEVTNARITAGDDLFFTSVNPDGSSDDCTGDVTSDQINWECGDGACEGMLERAD